MEHPRKDGVSIEGRWHLLAAGYPDGEIPTHRVDLVFHNGPAGLSGAVLSRADGHEIPLDSVAVDGLELRIRMALAPVPRDAESPFLIMTAVADHFEGAWEGPGEYVRLKLVRARLEP